MELNTLAASVRRWWSLILIGTVLASLAGLSFALTSTEQYRSSVEILVGPVNAPLDTVRASSLLVQSYAEVSTSTGFLSDVLTRANLALTPEELRDQIVALANDNTRVLTVSFTGATPNEASIVANAIAAELVLIAEESGLDEGQMLVLSRAEVPETAEQQPLLVLTILSGVAGAVVMMGVATLLDHLPWRAAARTERSDEQIPWLRGRVLGLLRRRPRRRSKSDADVKRVGTRVLMATVHRGSRMVVISTAGADSDRYSSLVASVCKDLGRSVNDLLVVDLSQEAALSKLLHDESSFEIEPAGTDSVWGDVPLVAMRHGGRTIHLLDADADELGVETIVDLCNLRTGEDHVFDSAILYTSNPLDDMRISLIAEASDVAVLMSSEDPKSIDELGDSFLLFGEAGVEVAGVVIVTRHDPSRSIFNSSDYQQAPPPRESRRTRTDPPQSEADPPVLSPAPLGRSSGFSEARRRGES